MNKIILFGLSVILLSCGKEATISYEEPANIQIGHSFESSDLSDWRSYSPALEDYLLEWTDEDAFDGEGCIKIKGKNINSPDFSFWTTRFINLESGIKYKLKVRIKTTELEGRGLNVNLFARDPQDITNTLSAVSGDILPSNEDWMDVVVEFTDAVTDAHQYIDIYFIMLSETSGTAFFDKCEIYH